MMHPPHRTKMAVLVVVSFLFTIPSSTLTPITSAISSGADVYFVVSNDSGVRQPILSNGNGTFAIGSSFNYGSSSRGGAIEDFDNDGDLDFIGCNGSFCHLFVQGPAGVFTQSTNLEPSGLPTTVETGMAAADLNLDGNADVIIGQNAGVAPIYFGDGAGGFIHAINLTGGVSSPYSEKDTGDLDGNGYPDVVIGTIGGGNVFVFLNTAGTFGSPILLFDATPSTTAHPQTVSVADFDGDGFLDIIAGGDSNGTIFLWKGNGTGNSATSFSLVGTIYDAHGIHVAADSYDFNGDGNQDLVLVERTGAVKYLAGNGNGTFQTPTVVGSVTQTAFGIAAPPAPPIRSTISGDVFIDSNGDGLNNDGEGSFPLMTLSLTGTDYLGSSVNRSAATGSSGDGYVFENVFIDSGSAYTVSTAQPVAAAGTYVVATTPVSSPATVPRENTHRVVNFGFTVCTDGDGDGFGVEGGPCGPVDCNDGNAAVHPGAEEICNSIDDDCNGIVDDGATGTDADGDGFSVGAGGVCGTSGIVDCNDNNPAINPAATEVCDGVDNNCSGVVDDIDDDHDGVFECGRDLCLGTVLPENVPTSGALNPNHYACTNVDTNFNVGLPGGGQVESGEQGTVQYTLAHTRGCTCSQIINSTNGKKLGLEKYGCSPGAMAKWVNSFSDTCNQNEFGGGVNDQCVAN